MAHISIQPQREPTQTELAWAAGIVDGEGCLYLRLPHGRQTTTCLVVHVTNTDIRMLNELQALFGGRIHSHSKKPREGHRPSWQWQLHTRQAATMLRQVRPFLVCKGDEADLILQWTESRDESIVVRLKHRVDYRRASNW